jgi:hypothetical protein
MKISSDFLNFFSHLLSFCSMSKISAFDSGVFREKNNSANAMVNKHFVRGFERGARRDHTPNIGLKRGVCQVTFEAEDSIKFSLRQFSAAAQSRFLGNSKCVQVEKQNRSIYEKGVRETSGLLRILWQVPLQPDTQIKRTVVQLLSALRDSRD